MMKAQSVAAGQPFAPAREQFEQIVKALQEDEKLGMTHGEVEEWLLDEGHELLRRLFQGHLDARGPEEVGEPVVGTDGIARTHHRQGQRQLMFQEMVIMAHLQALNILLHLLAIQKVMVGQLVRIHTMLKMAYMETQ